MNLLAKRVIGVMAALALVTGMLGFVSVDKIYAAGKIHLKKTSVTVQVKKTYQQKLINKKGKTIKATKVKWASKNTKVAKISKTGKVTAVYPGTAAMTAKYKGKTYKFTIKVPAVICHLNKTGTITVIKGKTYQQKLLDKSNKAVTGTAVKWTSSNTAVAKVSASGVVTAVKPGTAKITAKSYGRSYTFSVKVPKIWFTLSTLNLTELDETIITVMVDNSIKTITKEVNNDLIETTWTGEDWGTYDDSTGTTTMKIKAYQKGTSTITVYDKDNPSEKATLKVNIAAGSNSWIGFNAFTVKAGSTIGVTIDTSKGCGVSWYNYNQDLVKLEWGEWVDEKSLTLNITGLKAGKALIEVHDTNDPKVYSKVIVNVTN